MINSNKLLQKIIYFLCAIAGSIIVGTLLLVAVYALPTARIRSNMIEAADLVASEGDSFMWAPWIGSSHLDNFTDSIMLSEAAYEPAGGSETVLTKAIEAAWYRSDELENGEALVESLSNPGSSGIFKETYIPYWHGYLVWLKPFMMFGSLKDIRMCAMCLQLVLAFMVLLELYKKGGYRLVIPMGATILWLNPISLALSIQFASIYIITLVAMLFMLKTELYRSDSYYRLFIWIGIAIAYFDFLTYPLVALGIPLAYFIFLGEFDFIEGLKKLIECSVIWVLSYAFMWMGKWLVAAVCLGGDAFSEGIGRVLFRTSGSNDSFGRVLEYNVLDFRTRAFQMCFLLLLLLLVYLIAIKGYSFSINIGQLGLAAILACYPLGWYFVVRNHSVVHSWMTYRNFGITILAVLLLVGYSIKIDSKHLED